MNTHTQPADDFGRILRKDFPLFQEMPSLAYLDNAATTQKPRAVLEALDHYYRNSNANVHRSVYGLAEMATNAFESARRRVQSYLKASSPREIIFTRGTTEGLNLLAFSLSELLLQEGDIVLVTTLEHHANFVPWQQAAERRGARMLVVPAQKDGTLDEAFLAALDESGDAERVKILAASHVSNAFGTVNPVRALSDWCRRRGAAFVLDGAQSVPHMPVDVNVTGADFLVFSGHKVYGPMGSGVVWGREEWLEKMPPWQTGGEMISMVRPERSTWNELPYKFEAGTPDVAAAVGLAAALDWIEGIGMDRLEAWEAELDRYAFETLKNMENLTLYGPEDVSRRKAVYSFNLDGIHSHDVAQLLDGQNVAVRSGHHCAQPAMRFLEIPSTARASLAAYNTKEDIDRLASGLRKVQEYFHV